MSSNKGNWWRVPLYAAIMLVEKIRAEYWSATSVLVGFVLSGIMTAIVGISLHSYIVDDAVNRKFNREFEQLQSSVEALHKKADDIAITQTSLDSHATLLRARAEAECTGKISPELEALLEQNETWVKTMREQVNALRN